MSTESEQKRVVLGVSYDKGRLLARMDVLKLTGTTGIPASSKVAAFSAITQSIVDLLVIAVDVPDEDKVEITEAFRAKQRGRVIWARASKSGSAVQPDAYVTPDKPVELAAMMVKMLRKKK